MFYAMSHEGMKIRAYPEAEAICPECLEPVVAKCGIINIWHWAHKSKGDCDIWSEHETQWHLMWKNYFPIDNVEVLIEKEGKKHRADILTNDGIVIELQHSPISPDEILERESFYQNMAWVFDVIEPYNEERLLFRNKGDYKSFRWKNPRKHLSFVSKPAYLDVGCASLFELKKIYPSAPCGGWGYFEDVKYFIWKHGGNPKTAANANR